MQPMHVLYRPTTMIKRTWHPKKAEIDFQFQVDIMKVNQMAWNIKCAAATD